MPVHPNTPEPLKTALEDMEASVQSVKTSMAFAAPEMMDTFWGELQQNVAGTIVTLYEELTDTVPIDEAD